MAGHGRLAMLEQLEHLEHLEHLAMSQPCGLGD